MSTPLSEASLLAKGLAAVLEEEEDDEDGTGVGLDGAGVGGGGGCSGVEKDGEGWGEDCWGEGCWGV